MIGEIEETVKTGCWVGDCFIYTNSVNRLNYYVGGEIVTIAHLDRQVSMSHNHFNRGMGILFVGQEYFFKSALHAMKCYATLLHKIDVYLFLLYNIQGDVFVGIYPKGQPFVSG